MALTPKWGIYSDDPGQLALGNTQDTRQAQSIENALDKAVIEASYVKNRRLDDSYTADDALSGSFSATNATNAEGAGLPDNYPGALKSAPVATGAEVQTYESLKGTTFSRRQIGGEWSDWVQEGAGVARRELLQQQLLARKGRVIGTSGRGAIALRFDDYPVDFREKVLPLLEERGLPFTRVTTSDSIHDEAIDGAEFPLMQDYCLRAGGEVWNHGRTHDNATTMGDVFRELITPLDDLRQRMPRIPIDCFAPPGGAVQYAGYMPSNSISNYAETFAGQQVVENHALVSGYFQDAYWWQLDGQIKDGLNHYSMDTYTFERAKERIDQARDSAVGMVFMWHSKPFDEEGKMSLADFEQVLDYLVEQRAHEALEVLTVSGLAVADARSDARSDALVAHASIGPFSESVDFARYRAGLLGSTRVLTAFVEGEPGAVVTSQIGDSTKTHTIPEWGYLRIFHPRTIPLDNLALTVSIDTPATDVHFYAV
ncbi:polysaccharide deacetylase family protein [Rothia sp. CCM 9417]|uniref:polysaccharide deacetylase family protein n=1 Tax=Rothia sp. CCM 9417 TaxID=3402657 RepID=UPI003ADDFB7E